ncbi:MAG: acyloxyacyl hydrolase, partial [Vicinamibacterales bacterium]
LLLPHLLFRAHALAATCDPGGDGFERGCQTLEISGLYQAEVWDLNETGDSVAGAAVAFSHALFDGWILAGEAIGLRVSQPSPIGHGVGGTALVRRRFFEWRRVTLFGDAGLGFTYADHPVPIGGTRFNYLLQAGIGASRSVTRRLAIIGHVRHLHISNNSLAGRTRNPDFRGMGAQVGMLFKLKIED